MKKLLLILLIAPLTLLAQGGSAPVLFTTPNNASYFENLISENQKFGRVVYSNDRYNDAVRDVFLFEEDVKYVNVYTKDGKGFKVPNANYNLVSQQLQVQLEDGKVFSFDTSNIKYFENGGRKYILLPNVPKKLHEVVSNTGKITLLKGFELTRKQAMTNPLTNEITEPAKFVKDPIYYIQTQKNDKLIKLSQKGRKFAKDFPDHNEEIKEFLDRSRLSVKDEDDLIRIINYYNTLP